MINSFKIYLPPYYKQIVSTTGKYLDTPIMSKVILHARCQSVPKIYIYLEENQLNFS